MSTRRTNGRANATRGACTQSRIERDPGGRVRQATTISFSAPATIADSGNGLGGFVVRQRIEVRGSPRNSQVYAVQTRAAGSITVLPAFIVTESAGPLITVRNMDD